MSRGGPVQVLGRYALHGEIASGGMGTVHWGRLLGPVGFSRVVAIKRLHPQYAKDPDFSAMFLDEARVSARVQHPNVVGTLDVVALEDELFIVMEYVEGESLARLLGAHEERGELIPPRIVGSIVTHLLYGLHAAHEAKSESGDPLGIIHRDVSPQNVLVGVDGAARILDFGVAKAAGRLRTTRDGELKGKLGYMPVEQITGRPVDRRVDVYAASVVLWESLTGRRMLDGDTDTVVFYQAMSTTPPAPSTLVPSIPPEVDAVVMKGLARDPESRWQTAFDMAVALEETLGCDSPRRVGALVRHVAADDLREKAARVHAIESGTENLQGRLGRADESAPALENSSPLRTANVPSGLPATRTLALVGTLVLGGLIGLLLVWRATTPAAPAGVALDPTSNLGESVSIDPAASGAPAAPGVGSSAAVASSAPPSDPRELLPTTAATLLRRGPVSPPSSRAKPPPKPDSPKGCSPPYYFEGGVQKFKAECL